MPAAGTNALDNAPKEDGTLDLYPGGVHPTVRLAERDGPGHSG